MHLDASQLLEKMEQYLMNGRTYPKCEGLDQVRGALMSYLLLEKSDTKLSVSMACLKCFLPMTLGLAY